MKRKVGRPRKLEAVAESKPIMIYETEASNTASRRNVAGTIERTQRFQNIDDGLVPFKHGSISYGPGKSSVDVRDAVILCQKCYYNFSIFRNIIDLMTEFSVNNVFYQGGSKKSRDFFEALYNKINLWDLQSRFFREYYRSGNVFLYRYDATVTPEDVKKITQVFGETRNELKVEKFKIPSKYIVLNPADIQMVGTANFGYGLYHKTLTETEILRLKNPVTDEDVEILNSLEPEVREQIKKGNKAITIQLDVKKVHMVFYNRMDYEPFAVPMGYPVLEDINFKAEMKKIDMAIARTMQQIILLVTNGNDPDKGGINQKNLEAFKTLFQNQSVGRVLVADYTTKASFVVPDIGNLLDPKKYEIFERDINMGLNNVFAGGEKFANQSQKVELFVARLRHARQAFLNDFLIPEIKRIAKAVGLKNYPTPYFEDIELKDNTNNAKIYARLVELGILTPEQGFKAIESNTLPDVTTMVEEQKEYKKLRDEGLFEPLVGGAKQEGEGAGSPGGVQPMKKVSPIGTKSKASEEKYSLAQVKDNLVLVQELEKEVTNELKKMQNLKKLNKQQKEFAESLTHLIIANEEPVKWKESVASYCVEPVDRNMERVRKVTEIAAEHDIDPFIASILLASKLDGSPV